MHVTTYPDELFEPKLIDYLHLIPYVQLLRQNNMCMNIVCKIIRDWANEAVGTTYLPHDVAAREGCHVA